MNVSTASAVGREMSACGVRPGKRTVGSRLTDAVIMSIVGVGGLYLVIRSEQLGRFA